MGSFSVESLGFPLQAFKVVRVSCDWRSRPGKQSYATVAPFLYLFTQNHQDYRMFSQDAGSQNSCCMPSDDLKFDHVYHKNKDDHPLALKDDKETERLEPQNAPIRKKKRLQTDKVEVRAGAVDQKTSDGASEAGHYEVEIIYEGEDEISTLKNRHKHCHKSARHPEYIPAPNFCMKHLPPQYRTVLVLAMVKVLVMLTVLMKVDGTSDKRPKEKNSPDTHKNELRRGSGCVRRVEEYPNEKEKEVRCQCETCQASGKPSKSYAEIVVVTAAHVVFDLFEARKTVCYFDFDTETTTLSSCRKLSTAVKVKSNGGTDFSCVTFVTHDVEWARQLKETVKTYQRLCFEIQCEHGVEVSDDVSEENLSDKISVLYGEYQKLMEKFSKRIDRWRNMTKIEAERGLKKYKCKYHKEPSDTVMSYYGGLLEHRISDGDEWRQELRLVSGAYEFYGDRTANVRDLEDNYQSYVQQRGVQWVMGKYRDYRDYLERLSSYLAHMSDDVICELSYYTPSHPLTIIASHPHGLCKQISIGQVKSRNPHKDRRVASYSYTALTCNGSSGAYVYILGRTRYWRRLPNCPHSCYEDIDVNRSAMISE